MHKRPSTLTPHGYGKEVSSLWRNSLHRQGINDVHWARSLFITPPLLTYYNLHHEHATALVRKYGLQQHSGCGVWLVALDT